MSDECHCSVVIATYKRPLLLRRCLAALVMQSLAYNRYEIIVVDDGNDPDTRSEVSSFMARHNNRPSIRYLSTPIPSSGPAIARNIGWKAAKGSIIAFTDDDCEPLSNWLEAGVEALCDSGIAGAWGRIIVPIPAQPTDYELNTARLEQAPGATANCFYRKTALVSIGGFDERFSRPWCEDSDLQFTLLEKRYELIPAETAKVIHPVRPAKWGISLSQQRNNFFNALLYKKHPSLYRQWIQRMPPWSYYLHVAALLTLISAIVYEWVYVAIAALSVWIWMIGRFCIKRLRHTSRRPSHILEMVCTSILIPPVAVYWRLRGALRFRVLFF
jgi:glycosyltransferase involved in cell wall biosynthesis